LRLRSSQNVIESQFALCEVRCVPLAERVRFQARLQIVSVWKFQRWCGGDSSLRVIRF